MAQQGLTAQVVQSFQIGRSFSQNTKPINGMDFSNNGELMVSCSEDDSINVYDCRSGTHKQTLYSKKYGVSNVAFGHGENTVLHSSTRENDVIRYLSLHDNKYLKYFKGHRGKVTSLKVSPVSDHFVSCSDDKTIRYWDMTSDNSLGVIQTQSSSAAAFDPKGLVFGVGMEGCKVKMYDVREFQKGPFLNVEMPGIAPQEDIVDLEFSGNGASVLALTSGGVVHLLDAFDGSEKFRLGPEPGAQMGDVSTACFSPCGTFILGGTNDGRVRSWHVDTGLEVSALPGNHSDEIRGIKFNPVFLMFSSACTNVAFWLPSIE